MQYNATTGTTTVVNHVRYDTFSQIVSQTNSQFQPWFAYTGREWDPAAGFYFYRARWYDPRAGRFLSEDPLGFAAGDVNLSRYVGNGATLWVDPSGMIPSQDVAVSANVDDPLPDSSGNQGPLTGWQEYCYYLNNPAAMGTGMQTTFYVAGGIGLAAGATAGVLVAGLAGAGIATSVFGVGLVPSAGGLTTAGGGLIAVGIVGVGGMATSDARGGDPISGGVIGSVAAGVGTLTAAVVGPPLAGAGLTGAIAADGLAGAAGTAVDAGLRGKTVTQTLSSALYGFVFGGLFRVGLHYAGPWVTKWFTEIVNWTSKRASPARGLHAVADEIRTSGHPIAASRRTIAVGEDATGRLYVGSSNGLDSGMRDAARRLGVEPVPSRTDLHAEEELMEAIADLTRVGTSRRLPCGPDEHNCAQQLRDRGIKVTNPDSQ